MARCDRGGTIYKRHKYKNGKCKRCGAMQTEQLRALAERRTKRHAAKEIARTQAQSA